MEGVEEFILSLCDEIMLAYQFGFVKGLEIGIDTGKQLSKEDGQIIRPPFFRFSTILDVWFCLDCFGQNDEHENILK